MHDTSPEFVEAEDALVQSPTLRVIARPNQEALDWVLTYDNTGKAPDQAGIAFGWRGSDYIYEGVDAGDIVVTAAGTLIRIVELSTVIDPTGRLMFNRVAGDLEDSEVADALLEWTIFGDGVDEIHVRNTTRPCLSRNASTVSIFYERQDGGGIFCRQSTDDGVTWTGDLPVAAETVGVTAFSSPDPHVLFSCSRYQVGPPDSDRSVNYLEVVAYQYMNILDGDGIYNWEWHKVVHPQPTRRVTSFTSFWDGAFSFTSAVVKQPYEDVETEPSGDNGIYCALFLDDLAGRPVSSLFANGQWSDQIPVEAIDFAEIERDEMIGMRAARIGNKILMSARRIVSDTDFVSTHQWLLYYSTNGRYWSDGYLIRETTTDTPSADPDYPWNRGTPALWRDGIWIIGPDTLWRADQTSLFGGTLDPAREIDLTDSLRSLDIDQPEENGSATQMSAELENVYRQWLNHPVLRRGGELEARAGYEGVEDDVRVFLGKIDNVAPEPEGQAASVEGVDYLANIMEGQVDRVLTYTTPGREYTGFDNAEEISLWSKDFGDWRFVEDDGETFVAASNAGPNQLIRGTGLQGDLTFSVHMKFVVPDVSYPYSPEEITQLFGALDWSYTTNPLEFYTIRFGAGYERFSMFKRRLIWDGSAWVSTEVLLVTSAISQWTSPTVNQGFRLTIQQQQQRIRVWIAHDDPAAPDSEYSLFEWFDPAPLTGSGVVALYTLLIAGAWDDAAQTQSLLFESACWHGHDAETTAEEFLEALAITRGFEGISGEAIIDHTFPDDAFDGLQFATNNGSMVASDNWELVYDGVAYHEPGRPATSVPSRSTAYLVSNYQTADAVIDVDMKLDGLDEIDVLPPDQQMGYFGVIARADAGLVQYIQLSVRARRDGVCNVALEVYNGGLLVLLDQRVSYDTFLPEKWHTWRFVFQGSWAYVYCNHLMIGMFHIDQSASVGTVLSRPGYVGIAPISSGLAGHVTIRKIRIPWLGLGNPPFLKPGDEVGKAIQEFIDAQQARLSADGRILMIDRSLPVAPIMTIDDSLWKSGGYTVDYGDMVTHVRVVSTDAEGFEIVGSAYSPSMWAITGRPITRIEQIEGLKSASDCRDHAWKIILEQERQLRTRSYTMHPLMRLEKFDMLDVVNTSDDTHRDMYLVGINRAWTQKPSTGILTVEMTARMTEKNEDTITLCEYRSPDA